MSGTALDQNTDLSKAFNSGMVLASEMKRPAIITRPNTHSITTVGTVRTATHMPQLIFVNTLKLKVTACQACASRGQVRFGG